MKCGDQIAVPRQLDIFGEETLRACEVKLLGYLIGDGCLSATNMVQFANNNPAIGTDFVEAVLGFSPFVKVQMDSLEKRAIRYCVSRNLEFTTAQRKIFAECLASFMKSSANTIWTQKELAKAINVTPALVSQWVQGNCVPNQTTFVKLCQTLVVEPEEIAPYGILAITKNAKNLLSLWLQELGLNGKTSHSKVVPSIVFQLKREQVALFLNRLFATDGWATVLKSG
ncbi:helix-turn-helix domain-containing protein [Desmonostoc muscorum]|uniref:helix-turn-helix domain-containing protein n=1 Tax=Desmonostoc muscorum TaxID=1179 RepID=UPI001F175EFC|nr:helix-turn-helix domain-containing protein [Desmonostoc muscorum]